VSAKDFVAQRIPVDRMRDRATDSDVTKDRARPRRGDAAVERSAWRGRWCAGLQVRLCFEGLRLLRRNLENGSNEMGRYEPASPSLDPMDSVDSR
jgi:hypothetical protein